MKVVDVGLTTNPEGNQRYQLMTMAHDAMLHGEISVDEYHWYEWWFWELGDGICPDCGLPLDEKGWHTVKDPNHPVRAGMILRIGKTRIFRIIS